MLTANLTKHLGPITIKANIAIEKSEIVALYGNSGAGKTTIVNMLAGLIKPSHGKIKLNEDWVFHSKKGIDCPPQKRRFGYVFQEGRLFPHLSVSSNLKYGMKRLPANQRLIGFEQIVSLLRIGHLLERRPKNLSGGEKQRVAIGRSLLMSPKLLLMDEPLSSLDENCKAEILPFISSVSKELSIPVVYVSHSLNEIKALTHSIIRIGKNTNTSIPKTAELCAIR